MAISSAISSEDIKVLKEILEIEKPSRLLEQFYNATGLANFIVDLKGNILHGVGWESICTEFHRKHKISSERCFKSDTILANRLKKKEKYSIYICQNGMVDVATPIIIDGVHVANFFIGQFFFETPDKDFFIKQAEELGFDKEKYLKALEECHVYNKETILRFLDFFGGLINMIGESALKTIKENEQHEEKADRAAELIIADKELVFQNKKVSYLSHHDCLTDIYNRAYFEEGKKRLDTSRQLPISIILCMIEDITQRRLSEAALKKSEIRLKTAQSIANVGNWEINLSTNRVWASEQAFKIYGIRQASSHLTLQSFQDIVCEEDRPKRDRALQLLLEKNETYDVEFAIIRVDDARQRILHCIAVTENDENGKPIKVLGTIQDVTELKNADQSLAQSNSLLKATLQSTSDGILTVDLDGKMGFYNEQYRKMWGFPDHFFDHGDDKDALDFIKDKMIDPEKFFSKILKLNKQSESETFHVIDLKDGRTIERYSIPQWLDGKIAGHVLSFRDISERKRSEQALIASEAKHKAMIANISDGIAVIDQNGILKYKSPNLESWFGWSQGEFIGTEAWAVVHPDDLKRIQIEFRNILKKDGLTKTVEFRHKCSDGSYRNIRLTAVNMIHGLNIQGVLMNFYDITESKKKEEEILYLNNHDVLTGLYNRAFFEEETKRLDNKRKLPLSIIMGDINGLKLVNDAFGHAKGDKLLAETAKIFSSCCRSKDIVARIGGDEFCILLPQTNNEVAQTICRKIYKVCENYEGKTVKEMLYLSISLGCASKMDSDESIESILKDAEEYMYKHKLLEHKSMRSWMISSIKTMMFEKSHFTEEHEERLAKMAMMVGQALNLTDTQLNELELLSTLHDIGKISINDNILNKSGKLTDEEWIEIKKHPMVGYRIAQASPELVPIAVFILCHHERWDGKGYPQGLKGEAIPLLSRIISVVDPYDAMTHDRPYRKAMSVATAIDEIKKNAGTQFDPEIARIFVEELLRNHG
jgi:diguanylate cyclase (GGDEF)-like protein/PAS domain S-box-containing protein